MFGFSNIRREIMDRTVYMEFLGENRVAYRVISGKIFSAGGFVSTYGIEAEDFFSGQIETIPDFSRNIEDAVAFAESLIRFKVKPRNMYTMALNYLCLSI